MHQVEKPQMQAGQWVVPVTEKRTVPDDKVAVGGTSTDSVSLVGKRIEVPLDVFLKLDACWLYLCQRLADPDRSLFEQCWNEHIQEIRKFAESPEYKQSTAGS